MSVLIMRAESYHARRGKASIEPDGFRQGMPPKLPSAQWSFAWAKDLRIAVPYALGILESLVGRHLADEKEETGTGPALRYGLDLLRPRPTKTARTWPAVVLSLVTRTDDRPPKAAVG